jgi:hypothetical protein
MKSQSVRRRRKKETHEIAGHPTGCDCPLCEHELLGLQTPKLSKRETGKETSRRRGH